MQIDAVKKKNRAEREMTDSVRLMQGEKDKSVESTQSEPRDAVKKDGERAERLSLMGADRVEGRKIGAERVDGPLRMRRHGHSVHWSPRSVHPNSARPCNLAP